MLVFPELSLTGYELELAAELAIAVQDSRLATLRQLAAEHNLEAVVGAPLQNTEDRPAIGGILVTANGETIGYRKMHLGGDEPNHFAAGQTPRVHTVRGQKIGIAICADASSQSHPEGYAKLGADIYAVGVFLNAEWYASDAPRLAKHAARYRLLTVMANHANSVGTYTSVGRSAVWAPGGALLAEAEDITSCLVIAAKASHGWQGEVVML
jgi:predicted amidohydrolase